VAFVSLFHFESATGEAFHLLTGIGGFTL